MPQRDDIRKFLNRKLTVMLIPHSDSRPIRLSFSFAFLTILGLSWTGLTVWSGFIASRHVDYWKAKANEQILRAKVWYFAQEMKRSREYLDRVREAEVALQNLLNMKTKQAIVESDSAMGGPSSLDQQQLSRLMMGGISHISMEDMAGQFAEMRRTGDQVIENYKEIKEYVQDQRHIFRTTPRGRPADGRYTSFFGMRRDPIPGDQDAGHEFHRGLDIANKVGTPVVATADGTVTIASWQGGYGRLVIIDHGRGFRTYYAHNSKLSVKVGDRVRRGQVIAEMGTSGHSTGYHLHYEVWQNGRVVNPLKFVNAGE
jgi:murein DD-endopeptidase MepM/ murein hydrolase activator NlpD